MDDEISALILDIINKSSGQPLQNSEIELECKKRHKLPDEITPTKIARRLKDLAIEGKISGKKLGGRRGTWVWWKK